MADQLRDLVGTAVLAPGDALPSTRTLAAHLGVSRGTVVVAYDQLLAEGYLSAAGGRSTIVNPHLRQLHPPQPARGRSLPGPVEGRHGGLLDLLPGRPWPDEVVGPAWKAAWRAAASAPVGVAARGLGLPELRRAWSEHLRRMRSVVREPDQIAVTAGGREGLALLLLAVARGRRLRVGVEEPGYPSLRRVPGRFGAGVIPLPVDERGLRVDDLPGGADAPELLLVTPSHQYPLGGSLPVDRRLALLEWARRNDVLVVEDDYDSELRYTSAPLPAMAALDDPHDGRVVLLGTLSKMLTPDLAVGFLALPSRLVPAVAAIRHDLGQPVGLVAQRALAAYLDAGALRLHTQRMRNRYRRRRAQVVAALSELPGTRFHPMDGGLHAVIETERAEDEVVAALAGAGVRVSPLSRYWSGGGTHPGIVFGFGAVSDAELARALRVIAAEVIGSNTPPASSRACPETPHRHTQPPHVIPGLTRDPASNTPSHTDGDPGVRRDDEQGPGDSERTR
ncbi:MAG: PLP-dependent aminotransferase family protein [Propionibacteriaceae bacterium]|nr:PLP-dependent aminotransferase family protein [Propionibacteriaceae bacterium]